MGLCILFREMNISFPLSAKPQFKVLKGINRNTTHFLNKNFEQERSKKDSLKKKIKIGLNSLQRSITNATQGVYSVTIQQTFLRNT